MGLCVRRGTARVYEKLSRSVATKSKAWSDRIKSTVPPDMYIPTYSRGTAKKKKMKNVPKKKDRIEKKPYIYIYLLNSLPSPLYPSVRPPVTRSVLSGQYVRTFICAANHVGDDFGNVCSRRLVSWCRIFDVQHCCTSVFIFSRFEPRARVKTERKFSRFRLAAGPPRRARRAHGCGAHYASLSR